ncbi:MAG: acyltransferase family protein [Arcobacteraceae bacterium]
MDNRNGTIDLMKFIFAIFIFIHHSWQFAPICIEGYIGVEFFYMITGILLAKKFSENLISDTDVWLLTRKFLQHKLSAFYLEFFIATFTGFILLHIFVPNSVPAILNGLFLILGDLFLLQIFGFPVSSVVGTLWYLSAMMGALIILVPLILKYKSFFTNVGAPLICLIGYGAIAFKYGHMGPILEPVFDGFIHIGLIRAIVDISMGYLLYFVSMKIRIINFKDLGYKFLTALEIISYSFVIYLIITIKERGTIDFVIIFALAIAISISFSQKSLLFSYFQKNIFTKLGLFSLNIFLNHFYISFIIAQKFGTSLSLGKSLFYYTIGMILCSGFNYFFATMLRKIDYKAKLLSFVIKN